VEEPSVVLRTIDHQYILGILHHANHVTISQRTGTDRTISFDVDQKSADLAGRNLFNERMKRIGKTARSLRVAG
jgi:hypothetical protein